MPYGRRPTKPLPERPSRREYGPRSVEPPVDARPSDGTPVEPDQPIPEQEPPPEKRSHFTGVMLVLMVIAIMLFQHFFPLDTPCQKNPAAYGKLTAYDCLKDKHPQRVDGQAPD